MSNSDCCSVILGVVGVLLVLLCLGALYAVERFKINQTALSRCLDNTSVILTEVNHFVTASVSVREDTEHTGDFYHNIEVYHLNSTIASCSDVPGINYTYTKSGTNLTNINETTFFALAGSSVTFHICGRTNTTIEPERLDMVLTRFPHSKTIDFLHPGVDGKWACKNRTFDLTSPDYYKIIFLPPTHPTSFKFDATYQIHEINPDLLNDYSVDSSTLHEDHDNKTFFLNFGATHSCFVATIAHNPDTIEEIVHIQLVYGDQVYGFVVCGLASVLFIITVLAFACVFRAVVRSLLAHSF